MSTISASGVRRSAIEVDGLRSPLVEAGPHDASEAVVFVHGNPGSSEDWTSLVERVGRFARAAAWDHPGFGRADKPRPSSRRFEYTVEGYARHLGRALETLGIGRSHLVAHDFGGPWALAWAAANPGAFASATLIDTGVLLDYRWHSLARIWRTPLLGEIFMASSTRTAFRRQLGRGGPRGLPAAFVDRMFDEFDRDTRRAVLRLYRASPRPDRVAAALSGALRPLDRPALVLWGRHDPYIPVEQAERQRETFPSAEVAVLDESGHWPFADDRAAVEARLVPFLERVYRGNR